MVTKTFDKTSITHEQCKEIGILIMKQCCRKTHKDSLCAIM